MANYHYELLSSAGYAPSDPMAAYTFTDGNSESTTSSTYTEYSSGEFNLVLQWDDLFPAAVDVEAIVYANLSPSTDAIDVRLINTTDSENALETTGITTAGDQRVGKAVYEPTTTGGPIRFLLQFSNNDGSTSVTMDNATVVMRPVL